MKKLLIFCALTHSFTFGLLRDRTIAHYEKQNLNKLLNEIGTENILDAHHQIKGIQDLLLSLEAYNVTEAQKNLQSLFAFVKELEDTLGVQDINQVTEQIEYLQSLRTHLADFEWKR